MENIQEKLDFLIKDNRFLAIGEQNPKLKQIKGIVANTKPNPKKLFVSEGIKMHYDICKSEAKIESFIFVKRNLGNIYFLKKEIIFRSK